MDVPARHGIDMRCQCNSVTKTRIASDWIAARRKSATVARCAALCAVLFVVLPGKSTSQAIPSIASDNLKDNPGNIARPVSLMTDKEFLLSLVIVAFGLIAIFLLYRLFTTPTVKIGEVARIYTVILIIIGTLLLISAGFSSQHIAPALGLFGTIAGYLLGRNDRREIGSKPTGTEGRRE